MFKSKETPATLPVTVRSLSEADPTYAAAAETLARLKTKSRDLDQEEATLLDKLRNRPQEAAISGRVLALLGDAPEPNVEPNGTSARLKAIAAERIDLRHAIDIATQRVTVARFAASKAICAEVGEEYGRRVRNVAVALIAAQKADAELQALVGDLNAGDIAWPGLLQPIYRGRISAAWINEAVAAGYVPDPDVEAIAR
jgi:hypothetical protein